MRLLPPEYGRDVQFESHTVLVTRIPREQSQAASKVDLTVGRRLLFIFDPDVGRQLLAAVGQRQGGPLFEQLSGAVLVTGLEERSGSWVT